MALPAVLPSPIEVWRGDSLSVPVRVWSDTEKTVPVDLTGFGTVFTCEARTRPAATAEVTITVDATAAATGQLTLSLTPSQTAALAQSGYGFDVQAANVAGTSVTTLVRGRLHVDGDYTRADA